ncbi:sigma-54 dependent transcriptional regulator [Marinomonas sp. 15G1-11]|uniref:Sigma-54 dependent transcriptional regulator n=1 Tax=Marinomonas phaeophyticola TaxID=3004091 RepID=A0ABT4JVQ6_9GAMM|nr:sigma-54 dependent transcriptional regulator [Marinomonas sp. 15G1-11]
MAAHIYPQFKILLVDDEIPFLRSTLLSFERHGFTNLVSCSQPEQVPSLMNEHNIGLVLLDLTMPNVSGKELLTWLNEEYPDVCVIILSGINQLDTAVECVKLGAFDYFVKTSDPSEILEGLKRAIRTQELSIENQALRRKVLSNDVFSPEAFTRFVTADANMWSIFQYLESIATTRHPVLIMGESGVGKELIAQATHDLSQRKGPLITVNIAGLDDNIFADTLFGHNKGAFTGADKDRSGLIEKASEGTLFLDEIGDLSASSQVKLLRLLQEGEYYPLGSDKPKRSQARIIVATHQNLEHLQIEGKFRKDLYYRLKIHMVTIPPLRHRLSDLPILIEHFIKQACEDMSIDTLSYDNSLPSQLSHYAFPGNTRELKSLIFDAVSRSQNGQLNKSAFKHLFVQDSLLEQQEPVAIFPNNTRLPTLSALADQLVKEAMNRSNNNQSTASQMLGISQPALSKRLKNMNKTGR